MTPANTPSANDKPAARGQDLAVLMRHVAQGIAALREGRSWQQSSAAVPSQFYAAVQSLGFAVLRNLGRAQALASLLVSKPPPPLADALLCSALALLIAEDAPYPPHTLLDQTVQAAKADPQTQMQAGFINACLRRFLREKNALMQKSDALPSARYNYPEWWLRRLRQDYPQDWQAIALAGNQAAPLQLRVNTTRTTRPAFMQSLHAADIAAKPFGEVGVELLRHGDVRKLPGYEAGHFSVQDVAAQMAAPLLLQGLQSNNKPLQVLDACAAPGGKTAHLLEYAAVQKLPIKLDAVELDAKRAPRIIENLQRLQLQSDAVRVLAQDVLAHAQNLRTQNQQLDVILLDAPCTASGIVRRHPDVRWLRRESDIAQLAKQQAALLAALWPLLREGGRLLYCVCSVFHAEGQGQIAAFLKCNKDAHLLPAPGHLIPQNGAVETRISDNRPSPATLGADDWAFIASVSHDGFYYALLEKRTQPAPAAARVAASVPAGASARPVLRATGTGPRKQKR